MFPRNSVSALGKPYYTNASATGQMTITHFDPTNAIVSGTFEFNAVDANGETVSITDGRFDLHYNQN